MFEAMGVWMGGRTGWNFDFKTWVEFGVYSTL